MPASIDGEHNYISFSSGNTKYANCGIVGIDPSLEIHEGYDGGIDWIEDCETNYAAYGPDMLELADLMIAQWTAYRRKVEEGIRAANETK